MVLGIQSYPPENAHSSAEHRVVCYRASLAQRRLWFLDQLQPSSAYNVHIGLWLYGAVDLPALHTALQQIVNRHETLRTTFRLVRDELIQVVASSQAVPLPVIDFANAPDPYPPVYERARQFVEARFDLANGHLFRAEVYRIKPEEHVLLCVMHHTVTDAWSLQVFAKELSIFYQNATTGSALTLDPLPIQFGDFAEWQRESLESKSAEEELAYWKVTLQGAPALLELPQDNPRPEQQTARGATQTLAVPEDVIAGLELIAAGSQCTLFMVLLTAFKVLLYRYSGETDVLVGVPVAGRSQVETEGLIGFFVDTVVLRDDLANNPRFLDLLANVRETALGALAHAEVPFEKVVEALQPERSLSHNPIFQVMFSVIKSAIRSHSFGTISSYPYVVNTDTSILDLSATFIEDSDGKWWLQLDYSTDLYRNERIRQMYEDYTALLGAIAENPESCIDDLSPVTNASAATASSVSSRTKRERNTNHGSLPTAKAKARQLPDPHIPEQLLLAEIWKDVLGLSTVGIHDNFFDVGGHSLLAARLVSQIEAVTGRKLPVSAILRAPTIAGLSPLLRESLDARQDPLLMPLQRGRDRVPFFAVAAPWVDSMGFALLARSLGEDRSVYKLQSDARPVQGRPYKKEELVALAREYVAAMRVVQPQGPYCLGGMCDGVQIAQQMILELTTQGEKVGLFVIFDTWVLENSQIPSLWAVDYYRSRLRAFLDLPFKEQVADAKKVLHRIVTRERRSGEENWAKTYWPGEDFQPPQFQAPILLFKRPRQPFFYVRDPLMGWGERSTEGVHTCEIDCGHFEMLRPPHVHIIGKVLAERLAEMNGHGKDPAYRSYQLQHSSAPSADDLRESTANFVP